jgi:hypothetical protein
MLTARPLRATAGRTAVDGVIPALIPLLRLWAIALEGRLSGIAAVGARRVKVLILVVVPLCHRLPPIRCRFMFDLSRVLRIVMRDEPSRTIRTGRPTPGIAGVALNSASRTEIAYTPSVASPPS